MKKSLLWIAVLLQAIYLAPNFYSFYYYFVRPNYSHQMMAIGIYMSATYILMRIIVFYIFYLVLFPRLLYKRKIKAFILYTLLIIAASAFAGTILIKLITREIPFYSQNGFYNGQTFNFITGTLITGMIACVIRGFINWIAEFNYKEELEKKNLETSHALLKAQINPHFLFNTLNNIDVLIEKDPVRASTYLKKLSDILRFTLYESPSETIPLAQEVNYISQYIELQKIRTSNPDFVNFEVKGDSENVLIAPMLFIPFIENAFKHCTNKKISNAVAINISVNDQIINFNCSNAYDTVALATQEKSGLGLELITSRLNLLYPNKYTLATDKNNGRYIVNLSINIYDN